MVQLWAQARPLSEADMPITMGSANTANDQALCEAGDSAACQRIKGRAEKEKKDKKSKKGAGQAALDE